MYSEIYICILVHGKAVPETGRVSIVEHINTNNREFVWEPIAAGDWTFLGGSAFDTGFRQDLNTISEIRKPSQEGSGLRYIVIKEPILTSISVRSCHSGTPL